jgi:hypothetical protein
MPSRYRDKAKFVNKNEMYENLFYDRRVNFIEQYQTYTLHHIDSAENNQLSIVERNWKLGDRFYKLAYEYYNDSTLWWIIAWYNLTPTESHVELGQTVRIPLPLSRVVSLMRNEI